MCRPQAVTANSMGIVVSLPRFIVAVVSACDDLPRQLGWGSARDFRSTDVQPRRCDVRSGFAVGPELSLALGSELGSDVRFVHGAGCCLDLVDFGSGSALTLSAS